MKATLKKLKHFRPTIGGCNEPEPGLPSILLQYYCNGGFPRSRALALAEEYIRSLHSHLNDADGVHPSSNDQLKGGA